MNDDLDCKAVSRLISEGQDLTLEPRERARLRLHFVLCETCRNVDEQVSFLRRAMRRMAQQLPEERPEEPPEDWPPGPPPA